MDSDVDAKLPDLQYKPTNLPFEKPPSNDARRENEPGESLSNGRAVVKFESAF